MVREKFFGSMRRINSDYIPFEFCLCPSLLEEFKQKAGTEDYPVYYAFPTRSLTVKCNIQEDRFSKYFKNLDQITVKPDWGVGEKKGSVAHFIEMIHPMRNFETIGEFERYPYPNPNMDYAWDQFFETVKTVTEKDLIAVANMEMTIFEIAWYLRGMENFMIDLVLNPELAVYHLNRIKTIRCEMARQYALAGCDILRLGDDVATQLDMMMNPDLWREYLKPRLNEVIKTAKETKPDILIFYHGDGNMQKIIPDLIEVGVDILNPVQPECMDPVEIKKKYGDKISFWGTIGTQTTMPFGTPEEVRKICQKMIREVGEDGGLLLAPTHMLEPEVPWDNIEAFIATVREYNGI